MKTVDKMSKCPARQMKAVITLVGDSDCGKTATLRYLYSLLSKKIPDTKYHDFRECFDYSVKGKSVIISLSTVGDVEEEIELNWMFFRSKWKPCFTLLDFKKLLRPSDDEAQAQGPVIAIGPTHIGDEGARVNAANIANLSHILEYVLFLKKAKFIKEASPNSTKTITAADWVILTGSTSRPKNWTNAMASDAIDTAQFMKEQIEAFIEAM